MLRGLRRKNMKKVILDLFVDNLNKSKISKQSKENLQEENENI